MDLVYKAQMLTQGGRNGTVQSEDGSIKLKLAVPKEMKGTGDGPNPEQLFAAAFGACFEHSVRHIARKEFIKLRGCYVESDVALYISFDDAYRMVVNLTVHMAGPVSQEDADHLIERALAVCPYVDATKNNITLNVKALLDTPEPATAT